MSYCIGVDCDEVLCETIDELLKLPKFKNNNITKEDITSYYLRDIEKLNLTKDEGIHLFFSFFDSPEFYNTKPVKHAYETLTKRKKE
jgi:5'(3')-deoxyribonucleotidase